MIPLDKSSRITIPYDEQEVLRKNIRERLTKKPDVPVALFEFKKLSPTINLYSGDALAIIFETVMKDLGFTGRNLTVAEFSLLEMVVNLIEEYPVSPDLMEPGEAALIVGALYYSGREDRGVDAKPNYEKARHFYEISARHHNVQALVNLGYIYQYARDVPRDLDLAFSYFVRAHMLDTDHPEALMKVGDMYYWGNGVDQDKVLGLKLFRQARANLPVEVDTYDDFALALQIYKRLLTSYLNGYGCDKDIYYAYDLAAEIEAILVKVHRRGLSGSEKTETEVMTLIEKIRDEALVVATSDTYLDKA